jgi:hypothetical protein
MPISTYAELQAAIAGWLDRADLTARIPDFIALAECRLNRGLRLRLAETEAVLALGAGEAEAPLPADFGEAISLSVGDPPRRLRFIDPALMARGGSAGAPEAWAVDGAVIAFPRPADAACALTLRYLATFALSDAAPTNALLSAYPDLYLFAALVEAGPYLRDAELLATFDARLAGAMAEVNAREARSRSLATLSSEPSAMLARSGFDISQG